MSNRYGTQGEPWEGPCNGKGWIKSKENIEGFFVCRGCENCRARQVVIPHVTIVEDDGSRRPATVVCVAPFHDHPGGCLAKDCPVIELTPRLASLPPLKAKPKVALPPLKRRGAP